MKIRAFRGLLRYSMPRIILNGALYQCALSDIQHSDKSLTEFAENQSREPNADVAVIGGED